MYRPTPVVLPASGHLGRTFHDTRQHLPGRPLLEQRDHADFECHALFHDVYYREHAARGRSHKYLVRTRALRMANTHNARSRPGWIRRSPPTTDACFLHYKPLTTRRRHYGSRGESEPFDPERHVAETSVIEALDEPDTPSLQGVDQIS